MKRPTCNNLVMIVEDDVDIREAIVEVLADNDYRPLGAANGKEAIERLRDAADKPCVILLDVMMPVMDGWQFRALQREDPELGTIPVVVLSAHANLLETAEKMVAAAYLGKPVMLATLLATVQRFCRKDETAPGPPTAAVTRSKPSGGRSPWELGEARAERLLKITAALAEAVTRSEVVEAAVDRIAAAVDASSAGLWLVDEDRGMARLVRSVGYSESARRSMEALPLDRSPSIPVLDAIRGGEPIWISSQHELLRRYPHLRSVATAGRSYRVSCLPLVAHGRTLGVLGITIEEAHEATDEERDFLLLVARYASQAVERLRLFESERRSRAQAHAAATRMGVLSRASRVFIETKLGLDSRLHAIVTELGATLDSCVAISLLQGDGRLRTVAAYHPVPEAQRLLQALGASMPPRVGEGVMETVAATGRSVLIPASDPEELAAHLAPAYRAFLERHPSYAMICAPLHAPGGIIGTVMATRTRQGQTYASDDLRLFEELAERAAAAIENGRLYQENLDARTSAEQLYRFAQIAATAAGVQQVLEGALDAIEVALGTHRAAILLLDDHRVMRFRAWRGLSDDYRHAVEGHCPWPPDAVAPKPVLVPDVALDEAMGPYLPRLRGEGLGALAFIPLVTGGTLLGKLVVCHAEPHRHLPHEIELASAIANLLASVAVRFTATARLEETIRSNELFAGALAHDLRNPLGAIMTLAQVLLMRQQGEGDKAIKPLGRILTSGQRMMRMIDQLLDFTRARAGGGLEIQPRDTNLADLCALAVGELELSHPEWKIRCEAHGDQHGTWDPDRLLQIFSNLVANAGQHGDADGGILIELDGRRTDLLTAVIHNEGAVPEALLPTLFDPFRGTQHPQGQSQSRGLGLGLFIVKEIACAHGGSVDVTSSAAAGTTFTLRLPRHAVTADPDREKARGPAL
jgi:signal transduction histidine kinase/CheY-like chemotaxis protein